MLLLSKEAVSCPRLVEILKPLVGKIPVEATRRANYMVDRHEDKETVDQAADWLFEEARLRGG